MDRAEKIGLGVAAAGHVVLFGLLSVGFLATPNPDSLVSTPVEVSLVDEVGLVAESPVIEPPAPSIAPEQGPPEDSPPPAPDAAEPAPAPEPEPAPPVPAPAPRPAPRPVPKAAPKRPAPAEAPREKAKAAPRPAAKAPAKAAPKREAAKAAPRTATAARGSGTDAAANKARPRGSRLGDDFLKGLSADDTPRRASNAAPAQRVGASQVANIASAILRQVQPCANRQVTPGPGAERIRVTIRLQLAEDGSLRARPAVTARDGIDDGNRRYVDRVDDLAIATFVGCSPLRGLPADLYAAPGGWRDFKLRYKLPG